MKGNMFKDFEDRINYWGLIALSTIFAISGILILLAMWIRFGYLIYFWLKNGYANRLSTLHAFSGILWSESWAYFPENWIGINKILNFMPVEIFLMFSGLLLGWIAFLIKDSLVEPDTKQE